MNFLRLFYYNNWNLGFVERSAEELSASKETEVDVNWVKHKYKDRFFADPYILDVTDSEIRVLVEDFPYYDKMGMISLLTIDRNTYVLKDRKVVLKQPFHMSFPYISHDEGQVWVMPEASMSGNLYRYKMNPNTSMLENQELVIPEPLLDSTIVEHNDKYWLFCTKAGVDQNKDLFIYYSDKLSGPWTPHKNSPVVCNKMLARPAGYFVHVGDKLYRFGQRCDHYYGESVEVMLVEKLTTDEYKESFVKELRMRKEAESQYFHTLNGCGDICVVDGIKTTFAPFRRIFYEAINFFNRHK